MTHCQKCDLITVMKVDLFVENHFVENMIKDHFVENMIKNHFVESQNP
jgi:hypothetical protein